MKGRPLDRYFLCIYYIFWDLCNLASANSLASHSPPLVHTGAFLPGHLPLLGPGRRTEGSQFSGCSLPSQEMQSWLIKELGCCPLHRMEPEGWTALCWGGWQDKWGRVTGVATHGRGSTPEGSPGREASTPSWGLREALPCLCPEGGLCATVSCRCPETRGEGFGYRL